MVSEWQQVRLGELVGIAHGWPFKSESFAEQLTGLPIVVNIGNFRYSGGFRFAETTLKEYRDGYPKEYELTPGDILLVMTCQTAGGEILGIPGRIPDDGQIYLHNQRMGKVVVRRHDKADASFLYWLFLWPDFNHELFLTASGTKILHTSPGRIEAFRFWLPPLPEQRAIAHILGSLDDKIELNRQMNQTLEAMARAIFKSWFVDFDPVRAKANGDPYPLDAETMALFPDRFVDSELGEVPEGWSVGALGGVAVHPRRGVQPSKIDPTTPYIALEHMPKQSIALIDWGTADDLLSNKFEFRKGELLFGKLRPYFHKVGVAPVDGICSTDIVVVKPLADEWFGFVLGHVSSTAFVEYTSAGSTGTKMPRTSWSEMERYPIVIPPDSVAQAFTAEIQPMVELIIASIHESRTLAALRDALLPKLISGELRVSEIAATMEAFTP